MAQVVTVFTLSRQLLSEVHSAVTHLKYLTVTSPGGRCGGDHYLFYNP